jgi:O-antigen ligase
VDLWKAAWPEVPKYLFVGKGYSLDPLDTDMTTQAARMGLVPSYEEALYAGNYHNGLLSILIPFGLLGTIAFVWLLVAGVKVLYCNYRYGDARLRMVNTTLFSFFLTQSLFFFIVFGAFNVQIVVFLGTLGMSVSLNNGVCRKEVPKTVRIASAPALALEPA